MRTNNPGVKPCNAHRGLVGQRGSESRHRRFLITEFGARALLGCVCLPVPVCHCRRESQAHAEWKRSGSRAREAQCCPSLQLSCLWSKQHFPKRGLQPGATSRNCEAQP